MSRSEEELWRAEQDAWMRQFPHVEARLERERASEKETPFDATDMKGAFRIAYRAGAADEAKHHAAERSDAAMVLIRKIRASAEYSDMTAEPFGGGGIQPELFAALDELTAMLVPK